MASKITTGKVYSSFADGPEGRSAIIEISLSSGLPSFDIIGMCDASIRESRGRIMTAIRQAGFSIPKGHITVSITPSFIKKSGSGFDLPIAVGMLLVSGQIPGLSSLRIFASGELSLKGEVLATPGAVMRARTIVNNNFDVCFAPRGERDSYACCGAGAVFVDDLREVCGLINSYKFNPLVPTLPDPGETSYEGMDFSVLKGQEKASRAILLAAAGWHNTLLIGSPGSGKTTAARIIKGLMPDLEAREACECFALRNALGLDTEFTARSYLRPFRTVTPGIGTSALLGSASKQLPGEISLADHGVLFMDELCEFSAKMIDALRLPMEDRNIVLKYSGRAVTFPSDFLFVGATNPCRCGLVLEKPTKCTCSKSVREGYLNKLSGPFLDRIDLFTEMYSVDAAGLKDSVSSQDIKKSKELRELVSSCWEIQRERYKDTEMPNALNGCFDSENLSEILRADSKVVEKAAVAASVGGYSVRSFKRLIKVGRTIADLEGRKDIKESDIGEAMSFRFRRVT